MKIVGADEWRAHEHRTANERRAWRKLHLGVDSDGVIFASELTDSGVDDASVGAATLENIDAASARFTADGAYDTRAIYGALGASGASGPTIVIPPWRTASPSQARAENGIFRYRRFIGDALGAKKPDAQRREAMIAVNVVTTVTALGMPGSVAVGA